MDDVSEQFKTVQKRFYTVLLLTVSLFASGFILKSFNLELFNPFYGALFGVLVFNIGVWLFYRCPKCNTVPFALGGEGVEIRPKSCQKCGAKFR
ncbi:hypothetical protein [Thalassomonas actiniarum]|uniref:Uncharacterized protein n=1 Tax=Thalassomonas actiniarum TaxID=485447 RepID=A0AAE9YKU8_9GAMM|nr:hypothetical protein [Thalassomonas actiniarum]WDD97444.1 hypothetical protein SG35_019260 [Thalassomonas actiniarum]